MTTRQCPGCGLELPESGRSYDFWPHLDPPAERASVTVRDVTMADSPAAHARCVREWAAAVWRTWSAHHGIARELVDELHQKNERARARK